MRVAVILLFVCLVWSEMAAQRNCENDSTGLIPLVDLQGKQWRGFTGGLYYNGLNTRPADHKNKALQQAAAIKPLDGNGMQSATGKIVWIGVGASNPRTEFLRFSNQIDTMGKKNPALKLINTCIGGQGIQKMNVATDNYWKQAEKQLADSGLTNKQVQIAWIETDNTQTADTTFPKAAETLRDEFRTLLQTMRTLYPNLKLCYITARAYSGFVDLDAGATVGRGLLHPRDYYNGWSIKMLIEKQMNGDAEYAFEGALATIPFITWGSYHWTDGSKQRNDGFSIQCSTDVGGDGLHLSEAGEVKMGAQMFAYFTTDETTAPWLYKQNTSSVTEDEHTTLALHITPQPATENLTLNNIQVGVPIRITDILGNTIWSGVSQPQQIVPTQTWSSGMYILQYGVHAQPFCVQH
ncbi:MAG: T9SS type A sorting domain-containing protein [Bacteriodetes bacterium]|nr:T9SS type A sorting domain-containing protein [Bacteroidota bacterium]